MKNTSAVTFATLIALAAMPANAAEYLTEVSSEVYQTEGTPSEIAQRASTCISQNLAPGTTDAQLIISSNIEGGSLSPATPSSTLTGSHSGRFAAPHL